MPEADLWPVPVAKLGVSPDQHILKGGGMSVENQDRKFKVTIIDDEKALVKLVRDFLEPRNFQVSFAYDGRNGLDIVRKEKPDVVVLDISMPVLDGRDLLVKLKKDNETKTIPVIVLTGKEDKYDRSYILELGAYEFIPKPFDGQVLLRQIKNVIEKEKR